MSNTITNFDQYTPKRHQQYIFLFEMLGTFLFAYAIGCSHTTVIGQGQNFVHCFALLLPLAMAGQVSGGYFNTTITLASWINNRHKMLKTYVLAQLIGGLLGVTWCWLITGRLPMAYNHQSNPQMIKFIINQIVGSFFFSICVLALTNKFTTHAYKSWQIYISIAASLYLVRKMTADTPLNPAVSIFFQLGTWLKTEDPSHLIYLWILIIPPTIGGFLGGYFMHKVYQPLLLFIKFKQQDLGEEKQQDKAKQSMTTRQV